MFCIPGKSTYQIRVRGRETAAAPLPLPLTCKSSRHQIKSMEHHASGQQQGASSQGNSTLDFNSLLLGSGPQPFHQAQYAGQYASSSSSPSSSSLTSFLHQEDSLPAYGDPRSASSADFSSSLLSSTPAAQVGTSQQLPSQNLAYPLISRTNEGKKDQQPIITMQQQPEYHHAPSSGSSGLQIPQQQTSSQSHQPQQSAYPQRFQQGPSQVRCPPPPINPSADCPTEPVRGGSSSTTKLSGT